MKTTLRTRIAARIAAAVAAMAALAWAGGAMGIEQPLAGDWREDCAGFVRVMQGTGDADDLDLTYCTGQTQGIVAGMVTGSRIGAVSMASSLTVLFGLPGQDVFEVFSSADDGALLGYCPPGELSTSDYVLVVSAYIDSFPDKSELPVAAVFFEALQREYPCSAPEPPAPETPPDPEEGASGDQAS